MTHIGAVLTKHKVLLTVLAVMLVVAGWAYGRLSVKKPAALPGTAVPVQQGDITEDISATGTINPVNLVNVSSKITGLIEKVLVNENDTVHTGQVLMVLDDSRLQATLTQAKAKLDNAAATYERTKRLYAAGAISRQQLDTDATNLTVAQAAYDDAASQLNDTVIRAPIDGTVIGKPVPAGQTVAPGISTPMILATVADLSKMQIDTQVDETDVGKVKVGQRAEFTVDAYPGRTFTGTVSNVSQRANIQQNVVYYSVLIDVDDPAGLLRPSMTARVTIHTATKQNTLLVPLAALKENKDGSKYVQTVQNGQVVNTPVQVGLMSDEQAEITAGLTAGEQVLLPQAAKPGTAGRAANPVRGIFGR